MSAIQNKQYRVLLVDDNQQFIDALRFQLVELLGDRVAVIDSAYDGKQALKAIEAKRYDYIFMDISMPQMDGIEATRIATRSNRDIKIIALSFHKEFEYLQLMLEAGARFYIRKDEVDADTLRKVFEL
ncbi:MAG: response regulator [Tenuifilaceae bacterium]|jgi:CheY-like chemotaxis protein|nr:response regulator [Tenuifilaceae bacterium]